MEAKKIATSFGSNTFSFDLDEPTSRVVFKGIPVNAEIEILAYTGKVHSHTPFQKMTVGEYADILVAFGQNQPPHKVNKTSHANKIYDELHFLLSTVGVIPLEEDVYTYRVNVTNLGTKVFSAYNYPDLRPVSKSIINIKKLEMDKLDDYENINLGGVHFLFFPDNTDLPDKFVWADEVREVQFDSTLIENYNSNFLHAELDETGQIDIGLQNGGRLFDVRRISRLKMFRSKDDIDFTYYAIKIG